MADTPHPADPTAESRSQARRLAVTHPKMTTEQAESLRCRCEGLDPPRTSRCVADADGEDGLCDWCRTNPECRRSR